MRDAIFAGEHDGIDVLVQEGGGNVGLRVRVGDGGNSAAGEGGAEEKRRHPVLSTSVKGKIE